MQSYTTTTITSVQTVSELGRTTTTTETRTISKTPAEPSRVSPRVAQSGQQHPEDGDTEDTSADEDAGAEGTSVPTLNERELPTSPDNTEVASRQAESTTSDPVPDSNEADTGDLDAAGVEVSDNDEALSQPNVQEEQQDDNSVIPLSQSVNLPPASEQTAIIQDVNNVSNEENNIDSNGNEQRNPTESFLESDSNESNEEVTAQTSEQVTQTINDEPSLDTQETNADEVQNGGDEADENVGKVEPVTEILEDEPSDEDEAPDLNQAETEESEETQNSPQPVTEISQDEPSDEDEDPALKDAEN